MDCLFRFLNVFPLSLFSITPTLSPPIPLSLYHSHPLSTTPTLSLDHSHPLSTTPTLSLPLPLSLSHLIGERCSSCYYANRAARSITTAVWDDVTLCKSPLRLIVPSQPPHTVSRVHVCSGNMLLHTGCPLVCLSVNWDVSGFVCRRNVLN